MKLEKLKQMIKETLGGDEKSILLESPPQTREEYVKKYWQVLNEAGLSRVLGKHFDNGFMIISADRSCEAEQGTPCTPEQISAQDTKNGKNQELIKNDLRTAKFGFIPTYGGFRETVINPDTGETSLVDSPSAELSFLVPAQRGKEQTNEDVEALKQLGIELSQKYNQDSFLWKPPAKNDTRAFFITKNGDIEATFDNVTANNMEEFYFTQLRKKSGRFSVNESQATETKKFVLFVPPSPSHPQEARKRRGEIFFKIKE